MKYNFDEIVDRTVTNDMKWTRMEEIAKGEIIPMWVADMDLAVATPIIESVSKRIQTPVFGYSDLFMSDKQLVADFFNRRHNYGVSAEEVSFSTGVVFSISVILQAFSKENDKVMIMLPSYGPFMAMTKRNNRIPVYTHLKIKDGQYEIDFDEMEEVVDGAKILILCNPHNPTGKVFSKEELVKISEFAKRHNMIIISDEIHCDFDFEKGFIPMCNVDEYATNNTIALTSLTKTFNLAGIKLSFVFTKNKELKEIVDRMLEINGLSEINTFAIEILRSVYRTCDDWLDQVLEYIKGNIKYVMKRLETIPEIKCIEPKSTYLLWLDMSDTNIQPEILHETMLNEAKIYFTKGGSFGEMYNNHEKMNVACPRSQVVETMDRIENIVKKYRK